MRADLIVAIIVALIGALGLIVPGWLAYKGRQLARRNSPYKPDPHGAEDWQHSTTRDLVSREHSETRRVIRSLMRPPDMEGDG